MKCLVIINMQDCCICLVIKNIACNHPVCKSCFSKLKSPKICPICRGRCVKQIMYIKRGCGSKFTVNIIENVYTYNYFIKNEDISK